MGDMGCYCFESHRWKECFPHTFILEECLRQTQKEFIKAINEVAAGEISIDTCDLLRSLERLPNIKTQLHLYATNLQVDAHNMFCVMETPGESQRFIAKDSGEKKKLGNCVAPKVLVLKIGTPVVLIRNISEKLVNGSLGHVVDFTRHAPVIHFDNSGVRKEITPIQFTIFDKSKNTDVAIRTQIPLKISYALTIHKCQGMTVDSAVIDCHLVNRPGQLGVAISRVKTMEGVYLKNFHPSCVVRQPQEVIDFKENITNKNACDELSCCKSFHDDIIMNEVEYQWGFPDLDELDDCSYVVVDPPSEEDLNSLDSDLQTNTQTDIQCHFPQDFPLEAIIENVKYPQIYTDFHKNVNDQMNDLLTNKSGKLKNYICVCLDKIMDIFTNIRDSSNVDQRLETLAYSEFHKYVTSSLHVSNTVALYGFNDASEINQEQWDLIFRLMTNIRGYVVEKITHGKSIDKPAISVNRSLSKNLTKGARSKIRYVAGYCFAKIRYNTQCATRNSLYSVCEKIRNKTASYLSKMKLISHVCRSEGQIYKESCDPDSLHAITQKQNINQGLTHLNDECFDFSLQLTDKLLQLQNNKELNIHGEDLNQFVLDILFNDPGVKTSFSNIFYSPDCLDSDLEDSVKTELINTLFHEFVGIYSRIMLKQLRKDFLADVNQMKQAAHRVKVNNSHQQGVNFSFDSMVCDISSEKMDSHKQLKHFIMKHDKLNHFTKKQLIILCNAYGIPNKYSEKKSDLERKLLKEIPVRNSITNPAVFDACVAKAPRKVSKRSRESDSKCRECQQEYVYGELWIQCDRCKKWMHRQCAEIFEDDEWMEISEDGVEFICDRC